MAHTVCPGWESYASPRGIVVNRKKGWDLDGWYLRGAKVTLRGVGDFAHPLELRMGLNYDSSLNDERSSLCCNVIGR